MMKTISRVAAGPTEIFFVCSDLVLTLKKIFNSSPELQWEVRNTVST